jgi:hypothetical protein
VLSGPSSLGYARPEIVIKRHVTNQQKTSTKEKVIHSKSVHSSLETDSCSQTFDIVGRLVYCSLSHPAQVMALFRSGELYFTPNKPEIKEVD